MKSSSYCCSSLGTKHSTELSRMFCSIYVNALTNVYGKAWRGAARRPCVRAPWRPRPKVRVRVSPQPCPGSVGTLPWLSGGQGFSPGCVPCELGLEVVGFVEISRIIPFSGTKIIISSVCLCKQAAIQHRLAQCPAEICPAAVGTLESQCSAIKRLS